MSAHRSPVLDPWQRIARTALQVAGAILTLAPVYPAIRSAIEGPLADAASAGWVVTVAAIIAGLMSIPAVNGLLAKIKLGAISPVLPALDSETRAISLAELQAAREQLAAH